MIDATFALVSAATVRNMEAESSIRSAFLRSLPPSIGNYAQRLLTNPQEEEPVQTLFQVNYTKLSSSMISCRVQEVNGTLSDPNIPMHQAL